MGSFQGLEGKSDDNKQNGQNDEAGQLDRLAADRINGSNCDPVTGDGTSADQDKVSNGIAVEGLVHILSTSPADCAQNDGVVETKAVESWKDN